MKHLSKNMKLCLWVCRKCGRAWRRKKSEKISPFMHCGQYVSKARTLPTRKISRYERKQNKIEKFKCKYYSKPRADNGTVLKISKETKKAIKYCFKSKTKPAFIRRANEFIKCLARDAKIYNTHKDSKNSWCKRIDENGKVTRIKGSITSIPVVKMELLDSYIYGEYTKNWMSSGDNAHCININLKYDLQQFRQTLLHEALHYIDTLSQTPHDGHSYYWNIRLAKFKKMLRVD